MEFIEVNSYKDVPNGNWLVKLEKSCYECKYQIYIKRDKFGVINGQFSSEFFSKNNIIAYCALPKEE